MNSPASKRVRKALLSWAGFIGVYMLSQFGRRAYKGDPTDSIELGFDLRFGALLGLPFVGLMDLSGKPPKAPTSSILDNKK